MKLRILAAALLCAALGHAPALAQTTILPLGQQCFQATSGLNGMVGTIGNVTGGSGGNSGTYGGVALTGGAGSGATANITVTGGAVSSVAILNPGTQYVVGDVLSAAAGNIGGVTGFSVPVLSVAINSSLAGGTVGYYTPNTLTFKTTWKNSVQTIPNTNPVRLDQNGCAVVYGLGSYRQIVKDSLGNTVWDALTASTAALGTNPATSGAGDFLPIGAILPISGYTAPTNYVLAFGQTISRATFPDALTALTISSTASCVSSNTTLSGITSTAQMRIGAPIEGSCIAPGTTIATIAGPTSITLSIAATATTSATITVFNWGNGNGSTTFNVPDLRGRVVAGADSMGGSAASRLTSTYYGVSAAPPGAAAAPPAGQSQVLSMTHLPASPPTGTVSQITPAGTVTLNSAATNVVNSGTGVTANLTGGGAALLQATITAAFTGTPVTPTFTGANLGSATPFSIVQPTMTVNYAVKVSNGTLPTVGVLSLGGMTGDILCGTGLDCSGQIIALGGTFGAATIFGNPTAGALAGNPFTIQGLTLKAVPDANNDMLVMWDNVAGSLKRVTPGSISSSGVAGVSSLGGMTGAITCGLGTVCSGSTISINKPYLLANLTCDGVTDNAAALNAAFTAAAAIGRSLVLPEGTCLINSPITVSGQGFNIIGQGNVPCFIAATCNGFGGSAGGTTIRSTFANGDVFTFNVNGGQVQHLKFDSRDAAGNPVVRMSGATIKLTPNGATLFDVGIENNYVGVFNTGIVNKIIGSFIGAVGGPMTSRAVVAQSGGIINYGGILQISTTVIDSGSPVAANMAEYGIQNAGEIDISTSYIFRFNRGIWAIPGGGQGAIMGAANIWVDSILNSAIDLDGTSGTGELEAMITGSWLSCGFSSTTCTAAVNLGPRATRITLGNNLLVAYNSGVGVGVQINNGSMNSQISMTGNQFGLGAGLGFAQGVFTANNIGGWNVTGNNFDGNTTAALLSAGNDDYVIAGNNMTRNTNKIINLSAAAVNSKVGLNTGVNNGTCSAAAPC